MLKIYAFLPLYISIIQPTFIHSCTQKRETRAAVKEQGKMSFHISIHPQPVSDRFLVFFVHNVARAALFSYNAQMKQHSSQLM